MQRLRKLQVNLQLRLSNTIPVRTATQASDLFVNPNFSDTHKEMSPYPCPCLPPQRMGMTAVPAAAALCPQPILLSGRGWEHGKSAKFK